MDRPHLDEASKPLPIWRGTRSSNPFRSGGESTNFLFLSRRRPFNTSGGARADGTAEPRDVLEASADVKARRASRLDQPSRAGCGLICASIHFKGPERAKLTPSIGGPYPVFASIVSYPDFPMIYRWPAAALGQLGRVAEAKAMLDDEKALEESTMRADEFAAAGDDNGDAMWRRIANTVVQLANNTPPGLVH